MLGHFLELTVRAPRILESWTWWQRLGFTPATVGETWSHGYAVATDGRLAIGLHDADVPQPTLAWVLPDLALRLPGLRAAGVEFDAVQLGEERFNEGTFTAPDAQPVRLLEARTWSPPARAPTSPLGWFEEYALPVADADAARERWERLGFVAAAESDWPWPRIALTSDTLDLGLHSTGELGGPTLVFHAPDLDALRTHLAQAGIEQDRRLLRGLDPQRHVRVTSPEGLRLLALGEEW